MTTATHAIEQMKIADMSYEQQLAAFECIKQDIKQRNIAKIEELCQEIKKAYAHISKDEKPCQEIYNSLIDLMNFCKFHPTATKATRTPTKRRMRRDEKQEQILSFVAENDVVTRKDLQNHLDVAWPSISDIIETLLAQETIKEVTPERVNVMGRNPKYAYKLA